MKDYKKEIDQVHMSDDLKNKIKEYPIQKRHAFPFKIVMPLALCAFIMIIYIIPDKKITEPEVVSPEITTPEIIEPKESEQTVLATAVGDDGNRVYTPSKNGQMGGMGFTTKEVKKNMVPFTIETLPVYKYPKRQDDPNHLYSKEVTNALMNIMYQYANKLGIQDKIDDLSYENDSIGLSVGTEGVHITLKNANTLVDTKTVNEQIEEIKELTESFIPSTRLNWMCNDTQCNVYEETDNDKENLLHQLLFKIKIQPIYFPESKWLEKHTKLNIDIRIEDIYENINDFTIISEDSARSILKRGGYYYIETKLGEVLPDTILDEQIINMEFTYMTPSISSDLYPCILPVYRYTVKLSDTNTRNLDVIAITQEDLNKIEDITWYFE